MFEKQILSEKNKTSLFASLILFQSSRFSCLSKEEEQEGQEGQEEGIRAKSMVSCGEPQLKPQQMKQVVFFF